MKLHTTSYRETRQSEHFYAESPYQHRALSNADDATDVRFRAIQ